MQVWYRQEPFQFESLAIGKARKSTFTNFKLVACRQVIQIWCCLMFSIPSFKINQMLSLKPNREEP